MPTIAPSKPHFSLLATSFPGGPRPRHVATVLFGLWFLLFFAALFAPPILDDADATHAQAARAMLATGDLVTLRVDSVRYLEKAPLPYWLAALSFRLFGFNTFAAHLPQALAVLLLMLLGHRWANQAFGARTGFYTGLALLTSLGTFLFTRILIPEALLSLLLGASLFAFLKTLGPIASPVPSSLLTVASDAVDVPSEIGRGFSPRDMPSSPETPAAPIPERPALAFYAGPYFYPYVMWASLALAVLTKGLVALVFFLATTLLFLLLTATFRQDWRKLRPFTGLLLLLLIAAPWHILAALRTPETPTHHGFLWFYFWNEHILRFLGRRIPADYNKLPGWLYWTSNLIWLFPWSLFLPLGMAAIARRYKHQNDLTSHALVPERLKRYPWLILAPVILLGVLLYNLTSDLVTSMVVWMALFLALVLFGNRRLAQLTSSPFHRIDPQQRTILLLTLFSAIVLIFFSLSTNQEYYTFPIYLPILLLVASTITRAEQTYSTDPNARRWITFAHAAFTLLGAAIALTLFYGLFASRHLPYLANIGSVLAHRGVGDYNLSMSHFFDLTTQSFAALRLPALLAALAFTFGPALAWLMRMQRRHMPATTAIGFTAAAFLFAAHLAFARFAPTLSSQNFAATIQTLASRSHIAPVCNADTPDSTQVFLFGDQSYGSSIPFYLGCRVSLVDARSTSMLFGSTFADTENATAPIFLTPAQLAASWGTGPRKILFVPLERRADALRLLAPNPVVLAESGGKLLLTDRPLNP